MVEEKFSLALSGVVRQVFPYCVLEFFHEKITNSAAPKGLTICAIAFHYLPRNAAGDIEATGSNHWAILILVSQIVYVMFYALGIGNIAWVGQSEVFPYNVRGFGTGMATATNWAANLILGSTFLTMMDRMTPSGAFGFYAGLCFAGWLFVIFLYPDLSGLTLEEVADILSQSFGIKESRRRRKALKQLGQDELRRREEALREVYSNGIH